MDWLNNLRQLEPLLELLVVVLWGIYIYFTIKTFREIKRQTDLQSQAFLVVAAKTEKKCPDNRSIPETSNALHEKWRTIISTHIPNAVTTDKFVVLVLSNRGRSDVVSWTINVNAGISPRAYLQENYNTAGESCAWQVRYSGHRDNIAPDDKIEVPIAVTGLFPEAKFDWSISYTDARETRYDRFGGDRDYEDRNVLASPTK